MEGRLKYNLLGIVVKAPSNFARRSSHISGLCVQNATMEGRLKNSLLGIVVKAPSNFARRSSHISGLCVRIENI